jgi:3-deoxy-7-phosphoheptulonate synthase
LSFAAIAAGADGLILEVHNQPAQALSDGEQSLYLDQLAAMMGPLSAQAALRNRRFDYEMPLLPQAEKTA